jgi:MoaA/NifB/PqqE/SkfB family radical SAM enzyme
MKETGHSTGAAGSSSDPALPAAPRTVTLEVGTRCNLSCRHCSTYSSPDGDVGLPTSDLLDVLTNLHARGTYEVWLSGGEPTLRPDLAELMQHATTLGLKVHLSTNGCFSEARCIELTKLGFASIRISFDGIHDDHDAMRGPGAFSLAWRTAQTLDSLGIAPTLVVHLRRGMKSDAVTTLDALAEPGCSLHIGPMLPVGRAFHLFELCPSAAEFDGWLAAWQAHRPSAEFTIGRRHCHVADHTIAISTAGHVAPCCYATPVNLGDPAHIDTIWATHPVLRRLRREARADCAGCHVLTNAEHTRCSS